MCQAGDVVSAKARADESDGQRVALEDHLQTLKVSHLRTFKVLHSHILKINCIE